MLSEKHTEMTPQEKELVHVIELNIFYNTLIIE